MDLQSVIRELNTLSRSTNDEQWAALTFEVHRLNIQRAEKAGKSNQLITVLTNKDAAELANYEYEQGLNDAMAYAQVLIVQEQLRHFTLSVGAFPRSNDEKHARKKRAWLIGYLTLLRGELSKAAAIFHSFLVRDRPIVHSTKRQVDPAFIDAFMQHQAALQDDITYVLENPDSIQPLEESLAHTKLDREFIELINNMKSRKPRQLNKRAQENWREIGNAMIDLVDKRSDLTIDGAAMKIVSDMQLAISYETVKKYYYSLGGGR